MKKKYFVKFTYGFFPDSGNNLVGSFIFEQYEANLNDSTVIDNCTAYVINNHISHLNKIGVTGLHARIGSILQLNAL